MSFLGRSALFLGIVSFSGAVVVMSATELRKGLKAPTEPELKRADVLVKALQGDELFRAQGKYNEPNKQLPERRIGKYLPDDDLKKIKKFLANLVGGIGDDDSKANADAGGDKDKSK